MSSRFVYFAIQLPGNSIAMMGALYYSLQSSSCGACNTTLGDVEDGAIRCWYISFYYSTVSLSKDNGVYFGFAPLFVLKIFTFALASTLFLIQSESAKVAISDLDYEWNGNMGISHDFRFVEDDMMGVYYLAYCFSPAGSLTHHLGDYRHYPASQGW